ncbi:MAG TPA: CBS domain-containing protein [Candidatus Bathyarchaeia archaeon]|nr:CBS domain-containing protein [Candidatus Bathyarchaeia archaeon]
MSVTIPPAARSLGQAPGIARPAGAASPASGIFLFLSELLERPVDDALGAPLGRLDDLTISVTEPFPRVRRFVIRQSWPNQLRLVGRWADVKDSRALRIRLGVPANQLMPAPPDEINEVRLRRDVLDKQVVDMSGLKIVRVNDVQFLITSSELRAVHVDVGFRGLVRRMGIERAVDGLVRRIMPRASYLNQDSVISWRFVETLSPGTSPHHLQLSLSRAQVHQAHPVDVAELLTELDPIRRLRLFRALDPETGAKAFTEVPLEVQTRLLEMMPCHEAADVLETMPPDEAADLLAAQSEETRAELLAHMTREEASDVEGLLAHDPDTAGGLMTTEFVTLPDDLTIGQALERLRQEAPAAETVYYVYVVNQQGVLVGVLSLRSLITEPPATPIAQVMLKRPVSVQADDSLAECAALVAKYNLLGLPVVRPDHTLLGVITVDDVLGEILEQAWTRKFTR